MVYRLISISFILGMYAIFVSDNEDMINPAYPQWQRFLLHFLPRSLYIGAQTSRAGGTSTSAWCGRREYDLDDWCKWHLCHSHVDAVGQVTGELVSFDSYNNMPLL